MQKVTGIGGVFFRAEDPSALSAWYEQTLGIDITERVWAQNAGATVYSPFQKDTTYFGRPEQQWMICFRVEDLAAFIDQLRTQGVDVIEKEEWNSEVGRFARIHDPEGNPIELWEPSAASEAVP